MTHQRWLILIGCFIAYLFDSVEIVLFSLALPAMCSDLGLTVVQGGLLVTAMLLGVGVSSITGGYIADNFGRKRALVTSLIVFGIFTAALSFGASFASLVLLRFIAGVGLGSLWSVISAYIVETWPVESRGRAAAFVTSALPAGGVIAGVVSGYFLPDWRTMFLIGGCSIVIPALLILIGFRESALWSEQRARYGNEKVALNHVFTVALRRSTILGTLMSALALTGFWGTMTWLPTYLAQERGLPVASVAWLVTVLNIGMFVGYNAFGLLADLVGRRLTIIITLMGVAVITPIYASTSDHGTLLWLGLAFGFFSAFFGIFGSYLGELFPTRVRSTGAGFCFNVGRGVAGIAPFGLAGISGVIGFSGGLIVCACFFASSALVATLMPKSAGHAD
jgi:MFS family permease